MISPSRLDSLPFEKWPIHTRTWWDDFMVAFNPGGNHVRGLCSHCGEDFYGTLEEERSWFRQHSIKH